jgi:hypothetical protein
MLPPGRRAKRGGLLPFRLEKPVLDGLADAFLYQRLRHVRHASAVRSPLRQFFQVVPGNVGEGDWSPIRISHGQF